MAQAGGDPRGVRPAGTLAGQRPRQMAINVPTELLRSFIAIVDSGSMAQATETVFLSQSALSLQMKRLEDLLRQRVFQRSGRSLVLSAAGEELASLARQMLRVNDRIVGSLGQGTDAAPVQLGLVQDFADTILPDVLARFARNHPATRLALRIGGSAELLEHFERARLDLVLSLGRHGELRHAMSRVITGAPMEWIGDPALAALDELPLALLDQPCAFRTAILESLEQHHLPYRIVVETASLAGLTAALRAGVGLTCRTACYAASAGLPVVEASPLPALPGIDYVLHSRHPAAGILTELAGLLEDAVTDSARRHAPAHAPAATPWNPARQELVSGG